MREIDEYLERKGAKYFVTLLMIFYVVGTFVFNIYLTSLNIFEFELLKLRYMFMGFTFSIISSLPFLLFLALHKVAWKLKHGKKKRTKRKKTLFQKRFEQIAILILIPWTALYAWYIFPTIPSGFGGAKPIVARLIGVQEKIKQINETIAFETGVPYDKLPFEQLTQGSNSAVGANVMILDRNKDRIFLLLTKDLYLSSTSNLAKNLIESGKNADTIQTNETRDFKLIPLIVDANGVLTTTTNLYEPPKVLTRADLRIAAAAIASDDESTSTLASEIITQQSPQTATKILAAVQAIKKQPTPTTTNTPDTPNTIPEPTQTEEIEKLFEDSFDETFLTFRADTFNTSIRLAEQERRDGINKTIRVQVVRQIANTFKEQFPLDWATLPDENYFVTGQSEKSFPKKLTRIFQGAEDAQQLIQRIQDTTTDPVQESQPRFDSTAFVNVQPGALDLLQKSFQEDTDVNRRYVSRSLNDYFNSKARNHYKAWNESKYLYSGREDEGYIQKMTIALETATSWNELETKLTTLQTALETKQTEEAAAALEALEAEAAAQEEPVVEITEEITEPIIEETVEIVEPIVEPIVEEEPPTEEVIVPAEAETPAEETPPVEEPTTPVEEETPVEETTPDPTPETTPTE